VTIYHAAIYAATLLTGATGLLYQVVWQKYLSFVVGSEARSVALVVAVFLAGLAAGNSFWGRTTERVASRRDLLRAYGGIELGIGLYAALFPAWVAVLAGLAARLPASLAADLLLAALALALPTFAMGATIPLLVGVVPETAEEVNASHARIYGANALGACAGAFVASFLAIPKLGLDGSLRAAAAINVAVAALFLANPLRGTVAKSEPVPPVRHRLPLPAIYAFTAITGAVTLSLEVVMVRVLGFTIGGATHNFAIVVGIFVLGLAIGSLVSAGRPPAMRSLLAAVAFAVIWSALLFQTIPYWPWWMYRLRLALQGSEAIYASTMAAAVLLLALSLLPLLTAFGAMFPLVYALIPKTARDYGRKCGWMYCCNTLGTAFGAVALSHAFLHWLSIDEVYVLDVVLLAAIGVYAALRERARRHALLVAAAALALVLGPDWDRSTHHFGLFLRYSHAAAEGWLETPRLYHELLFFEDGPDASVAILEQPTRGEDPRLWPATTRGLSINGNPDGDALGDYSTIQLAALLPYLHARPGPDLRAAVIGLGTGSTPGLLARARDVASVTVAEISSTLIEAAPLFEDYNGALLGSPKLTLLASDGFRYFARVEEPLDIAISATSLPWVLGVENLFTPAFYRLAHDALREDGVFLQWFPLDPMDATSFRSILANLGSVFPRLRLYRVSREEMAILATKGPRFRDARAERLDEQGLQRIRERLAIHHVDELALLALLDDEGVRRLARAGPRRPHTLAHPTLAYTSDRLRFAAEPPGWSDFIDARVMRLAAFEPERRAAFLRTLARHPDGLDCSGMTPAARVFCDHFGFLRRAHAAAATGPPRARLAGYEALRREGLVPPSPAFLHELCDEIAARAAHDRAGARKALAELLTATYRDGLWSEGERSLARMREVGLIEAPTLRDVRAQQDALRERREAFLARLAP